VRIAICLLLLGAPLTGQASDPAPLRIGLLLPPEEAEAASLRQGVALAAEHANQAPGPRVEVVVRGRPGQWGADGDEAARMALDDEVGGLIAPPGGAASHLTLQVAGRTAIPVVSLCPDSSVTQAGIPWMVRMVPRNDEEAKLLFTTTTNATSPTPRHCAAVVPDGRAGREVSADLARAAQTRSVRLDKPVEISTNLVGLAEVCTLVLKARPDGILLWLDPVPAGRLAKALRQAGFKGLLAGPSRLCSSAFTLEAGSAAEGVLVPGIVPDSTAAAAGERFWQGYRERYKAEPASTAAFAYDAALLLSEVLRKWEGQPPPRGFLPTNALAGATGLLRFDSDGNRVLKLQLLVCRDGRFRTSVP